MINQEKKQIKKRAKLIIPIILVIVISSAIVIANILIEQQSYIAPSYDKIDIGPLLTKKILSESDYKTLFYQTGLGKAAVDELLTSNQSGADDILSFQEDFFAEKNVKCEKIGIITNQESFTDAQGKYTYGFNLAPYKNGYVLITKATHSIGWRHGHAAIVIDEENGTTLEAVILGENSQAQDINKWRIYPSFIMLKLKDTSDEKMNEISNFANEYMDDIPYSLTTGLFSSKNPQIEKIIGTQCSHLVWYPFKQYGYDVDSDGSWLVTPKDIANSDLFEVVQIYGVDPSEIWP